MPLLIFKWFCKNKKPHKQQKLMMLLIFHIFGHLFLELTVKLELTF